MALVYSYIRFSSKKQAKGDSLRRQTEGEEWIEKNGHTKASLTLHDLGVSAFRGKHRHSGALRTFLNAIDAGQVEKGSILLVEHLDRLSREGVYEALPLFLQILNAGVRIAVLKPEVHIYSKSDDANEAMISVMLPLVYFYLAHLESLRKSQSVGAAWKEKRRKAREHRTPFNRRRPAWLDWDESEAKYKLNDGAAAIRFVFEKTVEGLGQRYILKELQKQFPPIGPSGRWNSSYIQKVLSDRAAFGEFQPYRFTEDGERVADGPPIPGYYPAVIDESLFHRAQTSKEKRSKQKGPSSQFVNIFVGLVRSAHDRQPMHVQRTTRIRDGQKIVDRRLVSYGHLRSIDGSDPVSIPYEQFETAILWRLSELKPSDLIPSAPHNDGLDSLQLELEGITKRLNELEEALSDITSKQRPQAIISAVHRLEQQRDDVRNRIDKAKALRAAGDPLREVCSVFDLLADAKEEERNELRMRIRGKIAEILDEIVVKPEKHFGRVWALAQLCFGEQYNCYHKHVAFGPGYLAAGAPGDFDLDNKRDCRKVVFADIAAEKSQADQQGFCGEVPDTVGQAASAWLKNARSQMSKDSFRVVPSKIARFVEFLGRNTHLSELTDARWNEWTQCLKSEIATEALEFSTARVTYSRAREMVRWLVNEGKVEPIAALSISANKALT